MRHHCCQNVFGFEAFLVSVGAAVIIKRIRRISEEALRGNGGGMGPIQSSGLINGKTQQTRFPNLVKVVVNVFSIPT